VSSPGELDDEFKTTCHVKGLFYLRYKIEHGIHFNRPGETNICQLLSKAICWVCPQKIPNR